MNEGTVWVLVILSILLAPVALIGAGLACLSWSH